MYHYYKYKDHTNTRTIHFSATQQLYNDSKYDLLDVAKSTNLPDHHYVLVTIIPSRVHLLLVFSWGPSVKLARETRENCYSIYFYVVKWEIGSSFSSLNIEPCRNKLENK